MNTKELAHALADETGLSVAAAGTVVSSTLEIIAAKLEAGERVALSGFGTFETRERAARAGRNPQTGESITVAASTGVGFKPATALKARVNK